MLPSLRASMRMNSNDSVRPAITVCPSPSIMPAAGFVHCSVYARWLTSPAQQPASQASAASGSGAWAGDPAVDGVAKGALAGAGCEAGFAGAWASALPAASIVAATRARDLRWGIRGSCGWTAARAAGRNRRFRAIARFYRAPTSIRRRSDTSVRRAVQHRGLEARLRRMIAQPHARQRAVERVARNRRALAAVERHVRRAVDEVERDGAAVLDVSEALHRRDQRVGLRLDRLELGGVGVVVESVDERIDELVRGELAQQVHLDAPRRLREHAGEILRLLRQPQAADVDLEHHFLAHARAVQHDVVSGDARLVGQGDAF